MNLRKIACGPVVTLDVKDHCRRAAELMKEFQIRHLPVLDKGVPVGMVSDRDLLSSIGWWGNDPKHPGTAVSDWADRLPAEEIMSTPLICLSPDDSLQKAARLMLNKRISAIPLVGESLMLGIVTETDFMHCFTGEWAWQRQEVVEQMTANVFRVAPEEPIRAAWHLMRDKQIRHLVILEQEALLGIVSDRDILAGITWDAAGPHGIQDQVRHIMTRRLATIGPQATLTDAAKRMAAEKIGALPVCEQGRLIGIITETDLLKVLLASWDGE